ncbi:hypothetical protein PACILC2_38600 [Paenibacillus cisolokensis]|uniref:Uncharacterized protein n=1 Tax=Paenibacillus cisolokensis TaxID=1658519 RepID=A0ABQ4NAT7_9BACL|nr:hypothetical protein PACILC2_38600 [Paenibacillus cisolokensis]
MTSTFELCTPCIPFSSRSISPFSALRYLTLNSLSVIPNWEAPVLKASNPIVPFWTRPCDATSTLTRDATALGTEMLSPFGDS